MRNRTFVFLAAALAFAACKKADDAKKSDNAKPAAQESKPENKPAEDKPAAPQPQTADTKPAEDKPAAPAPAAAGDSITLHYVPPAVGDKWTQERTTTMDMTISAGGNTAPMTGNEHLVENFEVLAIADNAVSKAKVTYATYDNSQKIAGQEKEKPSPIAGKTYTLEAGNPTVVSTDAGPAPADEAAAVQKKERHFGKPDPMDQLLDGKTFTKDQPFDVPADQVGLLAEDPDMTVKKVTLTYRGMDGDNAKFDMAIEMSQKAGPGSMDFSLSGTVLVDPKTNRALDTDLKGTVKMTGPATADGTMTMKETETK